MKITKFLLAALAVIGLTSCLDSDGNEQTRTDNLVQVFNLVEDTQSGKTQVVNGVSYTMEFNFTKQTINFAINGLQLSPTSPAYTLSAMNVKYEFNTKGEVLFTIPNMNNGVCTITNLKFRYRERSTGLQFIPVYDITYTVNGTYNVRAVQTSTFFFGETKTSIIGTEDLFTTDKTYYCVVFEPTSVKDGKVLTRLFMYNAKFAPKMPAMNLMLMELYSEMTKDGFTVDAPMAKVYTGSPQNPKEEPDYIVTNFTMEGDYANSVKFDYTAAGRFKSSAECGLDFTPGLLESLN
ncbi:MAG: hypothetical protein K2O00_02385 [Muribaculaceae bacterium]|nr:hypothetical protein [Muribaculaceae bacterium]